MRASADSEIERQTWLGLGSPGVWEQVRQLLEDEERLLTRGSGKDPKHHQDPDKTENHNCFWQSQLAHVTIFFCPATTM